MPQIKKTKNLLHISGISSSQIKDLLAKKHIKDVFVPECKNGETWGIRDLLKIDAWVLERTYSPLTIDAYEIKVDRQDFEKDNKWDKYYDLCHRFYFVCPAGLIRENDLPKQIGIIWVSQSHILHTKRIAERHEPNIEKLNRLLIYVLMARSRIVKPNSNEITGVELSHLEQLKEELQQSSDKKVLANFVKGHIKEIWEQITQRERDLNSKEWVIKEFTKQLSELGIEWNPQGGWGETEKVRNEINALKNHISWQTLASMARIAKSLTELATEIKEIQKETK